jgi:shikimate dehydrogenase
MALPYAEVIGDPIAHSKSPTIHKFWLELIGMDGDYRKCQVKPDGLGAYFHARRADPDWHGCNVTVPHKQAVFPFLDEVGALAREVGAVNVIFRVGGGLSGGNSDVAGILDAMPTFEPGTLRTACLIGSGGAALAALAAFRLMGIGQVFLNVRNQEKGRGLLDHSKMAGRVGPVDDAANIKGAQLVVNATTLGMEGQTAMPETLLAAVAGIEDDQTIVLDMVYAPLETQLLRTAAGRGLRTVDGLKMLVGQAASAFEAFFGVPPPRQQDTELRRLLTS